MSRGLSDLPDVTIRTIVKGENRLIAAAIVLLSIVWAAIIVLLATMPSAAAVSVAPSTVYVKGYAPWAQIEMGSCLDEPSAVMCVQCMGTLVADLIRREVIPDITVIDTSRTFGSLCYNPAIFSPAPPPVCVSCNAECCEPDNNGCPAPVDCGDGDEVAL